MENECTNQLNQEKDSFMEKLEQHGFQLTPEQDQRIRNKLEHILSYEPRIGIFGKTGSGKSSLVNALFGQDICKISDVEACTREPQEVLLHMGTKGIKLLDVPGVGESRERDKEYAELYAKLLPELDVVLWVLKADDRAMASDEMFYKELVKPHLEQGKAFFFVLNQVDMINPFREWDTARHLPGTVQLQNISDKAAAVANQFEVPASKIIPASAVEAYNLSALVNEVVYALPPEKNVTLLRAVKEDYQTEEATEYVRKGFWNSLFEGIGDAVRNFFEGLEFVKEIVDVLIKRK